MNFGLINFGQNFGTDVVCLLDRVGLTSFRVHTYNEEIFIVKHGTTL